jgi:hypothetical protein
VWTRNVVAELISDKFDIFDIGLSLASVGKFARRPWADAPEAFDARL